MGSVVLLLPCATLTLRLLCPLNYTILSFDPPPTHRRVCHSDFPCRESLPELLTNPYKPVPRAAPIVPFVVNCSSKKALNHYETALVGWRRRTTHNANQPQWLFVAVLAFGTPSRVFHSDVDLHKAN